MRGEVRVVAGTTGWLVNFAFDPSGHIEVNVPAII
jgi:hypothetical protein